MSLSLLSYQLQIKKYLRELGLSDRDFNKLDVKHSDINLLKQLQLLNPVVSGPPPAKTGFWGIFVVLNVRGIDSSPRHLHAYLAYNNVPLTNTQQINGDSDFIFTIAEVDRLPLPSSILQLKITFQDGTTSVNLDAYDGFEIVSETQNPLNQENTLNMLVNANNYDDGECSITYIVNYIPGPPVAPSITYTGGFSNPNIYPYNGGIVLWSYTTFTLPFTLTFPAGTTRVRIISTVSWITSTIDFVPTANQTTANVSVSKPVIIGYGQTGYISLILNNDITPSADFLIAASEEL